MVIVSYLFIDTNSVEEQDVVVKPSPTYEAEDINNFNQTMMEMQLHREKAERNKTPEKESEQKKFLIS